MLALPVLLIRGWKLVKQQTLGAAHRDPGIPCSAHTGFAGVLGRSWTSHKASLCSEAAAITITGWKDQSQDMSLARSLSYLSQGCSLRIPWGTMIVGHPAWHLVNGEPLCWRQHFYRSFCFDGDLQRRHCQVFVLVMNFQSYQGLSWGCELPVPDPGEPLGFHTEM